MPQEFLSKESVKIILNAFTLNHEDEDLQYDVKRNLDKINDSNVKDVMKMLHDYNYWNVRNAEERAKLVEEIKNKYGIEV